MGLTKIDVSGFIRKEFLLAQDEKYGDFQAKLMPGVPRESVIGVRMPQLRNIKKETVRLFGSRTDEFLCGLPHEYYEENIIHGLLVSDIKNFDECVRRLDEFLPYVDNWAVCDCIKPVVFKREKRGLIDIIMRWTESGDTYAVRFGVEALMYYYLDSDFSEEILEIPAKLMSDEYYVNMGRAWFFAEALAKQYDSAINVLKSGKLDRWTHNKSIQKAVESYRISPEQKEYLRTLKM